MQKQILRGEIVDPFQDWKRIPGFPLDLSKNIVTFFSNFGQDKEFGSFWGLGFMFFLHFFLSSTGLGGLGLARFPSFGWKINIETKQRCGSVPATRFQPVSAGLQFFAF